MPSPKGIINYLSMAEYNQSNPFRKQYRNFAVFLKYGLQLILSKSRAQERKLISSSYSVPFKSPIPSSSRIPLICSRTPGFIWVFRSKSLFAFLIWYNSAHGVHAGWSGVFCRYYRLLGAKDLKRLSVQHLISNAWVRRLFYFFHFRQRLLKYLSCKICQ